MRVGSCQVVVESLQEFRRRIRPEQKVQGKDLDLNLVRRQGQESAGRKKQLVVEEHRVFRGEKPSSLRQYPDSRRLLLLFPLCSVVVFSQHSHCQEG